jgi:hypothetical protein
MRGIYSVALSSSSSSSSSSATGSKTSRLVPSSWVSVSASFPSSTYVLSAGQNLFIHQLVNACIARS